MKYSDSILPLINNSLEEIESIDSVIELTKKYCMDKEFQAIYYNLESIEKVNLSEERNHYINLLTIAIEKISLLKHQFFEIEAMLTKLH